MFEAVGLGVDGAEFRMIAAAALGDVVEQAAQVGDLGLLERLHNLRAVRELVVKAGQRETAQVAHDKQRVLVHGVGMEQVVLHAADDAAERRDVEPQHAIQVHAPQLVGYPFRRTQDRQEQAVITRVLPEFVVDEVEVALDQADRERADAADFLVLLQDQEQLEQGGRIAPEDVVVHGLEKAVLNLEAFV